MLALALAFFLLFLATYYVVVHPRIKSHSAKIGQHSVTQSAAASLCAEAFEFCRDRQQQKNVLHVLVMYATEYGFAREVARKTAAYLSQRHIDIGPTIKYDDDDKRDVVIHPRVVNALNYNAVDFSRESLLLFICSTTGDGVPPNESVAFHDALRDGVLTLADSLHYAVLALGDSGYPHFCRGGSIFDQLFQLTNAIPALPRVEVDQEDWSVVLNWTRNITKFANSLQPMPTFVEYLTPALERVASEHSTHATRYTRANPYSATLVTRIPLCNNPQQRKIIDPKNVIRVEFDVNPEKLPYTPGDAVGVLPLNNSEAVNGILKLLAVNGDEQVVLDGPDTKPISIEFALLEKLDLRVIRPELINKLGISCTTKSERALYERLIALDTTTTGMILTDEGKEYVKIRHVVDVLSDFGSAQLDVVTFVRLLRPLQTRYYSISSNNPSRIAATLDVVRYMARGVAREGVASTYLSDRVRLDDNVSIFISRNADFRLPDETGKHILMIGAGTGIAPYIGFLEQRVLQSATGRNVLYFGCRHEDHDFLYKDRLKSWVKRDELELHTAFSRDQKEKIYIQNLLRSNKEDVWQLLDDGAHVYVCGDGNQMARDVHLALRDVILDCGGVEDVREAEEYLEKLQKTRRYQRDVWVSST